MGKRVGVIGAGLAGLSAATSLAAEGFEVDVFEKNSSVGGRARQFSSKGFAFDMGPSWYWMPDVFENYFNRFGHTSSDYYELKKLDPGFRVIFGKNEVIDIPESFEELCGLFESLQTGAAEQLRRFMKEAQYKYEVAMEDLVYRPTLSVADLISIVRKASVRRLGLLSSYAKHVRKHFSDPRLIAIMEFPVLFLGAMPDKTPALYSMMSYAGLKLGTYYPLGGMVQVPSAFMKLAEELGVRFHLSEEVTSISTSMGGVTELVTRTGRHVVDAVIAAADYHHVETALLNGDRNYSGKYWDSRVLAPSSLLFYLGINGRVPRLQHHNLFFDADLQTHAHEIYADKQWPSKPLFYVCCPSQTDDSLAPAGSENLFVLMPIATGLEDTPELREKYFNVLIARLSAHVGEDIRSRILVKRSYCSNDFIEDYHAFKGNAYGLANTLRQTANFKPRMQNRKLKNLFYAGQLTAPGPGVPPAIISGQIAASLLTKHMS